MTVSGVLIIIMGVLFAAGVYAMLERSLTRVLIGFLLLGNAANLFLLIVMGRPGVAPFYGAADPSEMSDPLPQAMVLTAIVIGLALTAFMLAMAYRTWQLNGDDEVQDDREDRRIALAAARDAVAERVTDDSGATLDEQAASIFDETEDLPAVMVTPPPKARKTQAGGADSEPR